MTSPRAGLPPLCEDWRTRWYAVDPYVARGTPREVGLAWVSALVDTLVVGVIELLFVEAQSAPDLVTAFRVLEPIRDREGVERARVLLDAALRRSDPDRTDPGLFTALARTLEDAATLRDTQSVDQVNWCLHALFARDGSLDAVLRGAEASGVALHEVYRLLRWNGL